MLGYAKRITRFGKMENLGRKEKANQKKKSTVHDQKETYRAKDKEVKSSARSDKRKWVRPCS